MLKSVKIKVIGKIMDKDLKKFQKIFENSLSKVNEFGEDHEDEINNLEQGLTMLDDQMRSALHTAQDLSRFARKNGAPSVFAGQLDSYLIGHLRAFIQDTNQPGSIASLLRMIEQEKERE